MFRYDYIQKNMCCNCGKCWTQYPSTCTFTDQNIIIYTALERWSGRWHLWRFLSTWLCLCWIWFFTGWQFLVHLIIIYFFTCLHIIHISDKMSLERWMTPFKLHIWHLELLVYLEVWAVRKMTLYVSHHLRGKLSGGLSCFVVSGDITHNSIQTTMAFHQKSLPDLHSLSCRK